MTTNMPELFILLQAAHDIVVTARREGTLGSLTVNTVRRQVERDFSLDEGTLNQGTTKTALRNAVNTALSEDTEVNTVKKRKRPPKGSVEREEVKPKKIKRVGKEQDVKEKSGGEEGSGTGQKKIKLQPRSVKSKETIVTDSEDGEDATALEATASTSKSKQDILEAPARSAKKFKHSSKSSGGRQAEPPAPKSVDATSESELSVLIDGPPRRKRTKAKTKEGTKKTTAQKSKEEQDSGNALSPDEETIKKLKSYVSACGVRKPWSKEFADLPLPGQQITRLKEILSDLGMTGKYSLEKARAIKKKRALARELNEVVEFERKAGVSRGKRSRSKGNGRRTVGELDTDSAISESEFEDLDSPGAKKKDTASSSIMAYLANQSSEGDD